MQVRDREEFLQRQKVIYNLLSSHPLFAQKQSLLEDLNTHKISDVLNKLDALHTVFVQEKKILSQMKLHPTSHDVDVSLATSFVKSYKDQVSRLTKTDFTSLQEFVFHSKELAYPHLEQDLSKFASVANRVDEYERLWWNINRQQLAAKRLAYLAHSNADIAHKQKETLLALFDDQKAHMMRLHPFTL